MIHAHRRQAENMHAHSPDDIGFLEQTDELFKANLALMRQCWPDLHAKLVNLTAPHTALVRVGSDDWDVEFRGSRFFGNGSRATATEQVAQFIAAPQRFGLGPVGSGSLDRYANSMAVSLLKRATEEGINFNSMCLEKTSWHLVVFGWGLGDHIFPLLEHTQAHNLVIVESNLEMILHSLRTFDWQRLIVAPPAKPLSITWMLDELPPDLVAINIRANIRKTNLPRLDGSYCFQHYPNTFLQRVKDALLNDLGQTLKGLGYIDDELKMIRNAYQNLSSESALLFQRPETRRQWPIFVIGSGPSLDKSMDIVKANADRAIIIAAGTALPILNRHGIEPDFFAELENGEPIYDWILRVTKDDGPGKTILVASDTVDGRLKTLFEQTIFFIRPGLASTPIFAGTDNGAHSLQFMYPTVGNTAFAFALGAGFREIYFFGMDLGSKQPDRHHANHSPYETGDEVAYTFTMNISRKGNFGGTVMTDNVMDWGRDVFEATMIQAARGRMVYNCSDGVYIKGILPKLPETVSIHPPKTTREQEMAAILKGWEPYGRENFDEAWTRADLENGCREFSERLKAACIIECDDPLYFLKALNELALTENHHSWHNIYRGTLLLAMITGAYYVTHAEDNRHREVAEIFVEELSDLIDRMTEYTLDFLRGMRETGHYDLPLS